MGKIEILECCVPSASGCRAIFLADDRLQTLGQLGARFGAWFCNDLGHLIADLVQYTQLRGQIFSCSQREDQPLGQVAFGPLRNRVQLIQKALRRLTFKWLVQLCVLDDGNCSADKIAPCRASIRTRRTRANERNNPSYVERARKREPASLFNAFSCKFGWSIGISMCPHFSAHLIPFISSWPYHSSIGPEVGQ